MYFFHCLLQYEITIAAIGVGFRLNFNWFLSNKGTHGNYVGLLFTKRSLVS